MSNGKIYIVVAAGGEYEDAWQRNEISFYEADKAEDYATEANSRVKSMNHDIVKFENLITGWYDNYEKDDWIPPLKVPKWPAGIAEKDITPEMRAERTKIRLKNEKIDKINRENSLKQQNAFSEFQRKFFMDLGYDENDEKNDLVFSGHIRESDAFYSVEEIEVL